MKPKEIKKVNGVAVATLYGNQKAKVHLRAVEIGGDTVTALSCEDSTVVMRVGLEFYDGENLTNNFVLCNELNIITKASVLPTTDLGSDLLKEWFVDEVCGLHVVESISE